MVSCADDGANSAAVYQVAEGVQLQSLSPGFTSSDTILLCKKQSKLCTVASNTSDRYDEWHPEILEAFHAGKFIVYKPNKAFSAIAIDQAHEQPNAVDVTWELSA